MNSQIEGNETASRLSDEEVFSLVERAARNNHKRWEGTEAQINSLISGFSAERNQFSHCILTFAEISWIFIKALATLCDKLHGVGVSDVESGTHVHAKCIAIRGRYSGLDLRETDSFLFEILNLVPAGYAGTLLGATVKYRDLILRRGTDEEHLNAKVEPKINKAAQVIILENFKAQTNNVLNEE